METFTVLAGIGSLLFALLAIVSIVLIVASSTLVLVYGLIRGGSSLIQELASVLRLTGSHTPLRS